MQQLNPSQQQVVRWDQGPLLVLAGPGSGKTLVLAMHIAHLLEQSEGETFHVLGLTFTVKAAQELEHRIREYVGSKARRVKACTFHSFCKDLLGQHGSHLGLRPDFDIVNEDRDRASLLQDAMGRLPDLYPAPDLNEAMDLLKKINKMFTMGIESKNLPKSFSEDRRADAKNLGCLFDAYLETLVESNQLDYGAMLHLAQVLLKSKKGVARRVRIIHKYLCVDEFQDTNTAQYALLRLLAPAHQANLMVVADDDQTVFQWAGADPRRIKTLVQDYQSFVIQLPENYRCPQEILDLANRLIRFNRDRAIGKCDLKAQGKNHGSVRHQGYQTSNDELIGLAKELSKIATNQRHKCLVIARNNKLLAKAREVLNSQGIKAEIVAKKQNYSPPMQIMVAALKMAKDPSSQFQLHKLCKGVGQLWYIQLTGEDVVEQARFKDSSLLKAFFEELLATEAPTEDHKPFAELGIKTLCQGLDFRQFIEKVLSLFEANTTKLQGSKFMSTFEDEHQHWQRLYQKKVREHDQHLTLHALLQDVDMTPKQPDLNNRCVRLQTVHTAKGTQFNHVFVIGLAEELFPSFHALKQGADPKALEEERRGCFVAITRASESLYLSYAREYEGWDKKPSSFLVEMGLITS